MRYIKEIDKLIYIKKHKNLNSILKKFKCDYIELQKMLPRDKITFSDSKFDDKTVVELTNKSLEAIAKHRIQILQYWIPIIISNTMAFIALIISILK